MKNLLLLTSFLLLSVSAVCQEFTRQDTLRGSNGRGRSWWDVQHYHLSLWGLNYYFDTTDKNIIGENTITLKVISTPIDSLQLDLQEPMILDSVIYNSEKLIFVREGNVFWIKYPFHKWEIESEKKLVAHYHGKPRQAINPPWDGGFIWTKDSTGKPWMAVACQGLGASCWWPCKDYQGDEPDNGMKFNIGHPYTYFVSNGRNFDQDTETVYDPVHDSAVVSKVWDKFNWVTQNPINSYDLSFYIGDYISWTDTIMGEKGKLDLSFYAMRYNEQKARDHFKVVKQMLHCYEYWMGPYPFYEDGYKLVEAPFLGMEHQSAIAYGNKYLMGYLGKDRSGTGIGLNFDYIIIHESGHEWFGNNITAADIADNWLHEGFTTYIETLFAECLLGKEKAFEYTRGVWNLLDNKKPIIGQYGVQNDGSGDKYEKGAAVVHMIRMIINDDEKFRQLLRSLNKDFYHKIVTSAEVEAYINKFTGYDFTAIFNQYLRTANVPQLEYFIKRKKLFYRFTDVVENFKLPLEVEGDNKKAKIAPTAEWQHCRWKGGYELSFSKDFLFKIKG